MKLFFLFLFPFLLCGNNPVVPLAANAGSDITLCPEISGNLTGTANGGTGPYTFHWEPSVYCTNSNSATTGVNISVTTTFTLTVIDASQDTSQDLVTVYVNDFNTFGAGPDKGRCYNGGAAVSIGDADNYQGNNTFSWQPTSDLSNPTAPKPLATPSVTTTFTVTVTSNGCGTLVDSVIVYVWNSVPDAGENVTIQEGEVVTLNGTGATVYNWFPLSNILYDHTANPDVNPTSTTVYTLQGFDENGCVGYDDVTVFVRPGSELFFYNTFTPNGDGSNDTWAIGNISKYPDNKLEIYNRYGQVVYKKSGYSGDWNGIYLGQELPAGTYYYLLDTRSDAGKFKGSVTIMR
jgi:gliding motility-associated-like protein